MSLGVILVLMGAFGWCFFSAFVGWHFAGTLLGFTGKKGGEI